MQPMQPTRFACDRCRGQKLRCIRDRGFYQPCKRCEKAGVACLDSPPARMGRTHRTSNTYSLGHVTQEPEIQEPLQVENEELFPMLTEDSSLSHPTDIRFGNVSDADLSMTSLDYWNHWNPLSSSSSNAVESSEFASSEKSSLLRSKPCEGQELQYTLPAPSPSSILEYIPNYGTRAGNSDQNNSTENQDRGTSQDQLRLGDLDPIAASNADPGTNHLLAGAQCSFPGETEMKQLLELTQSLYMQQMALEAASWATCLSSLSLTTGPRQSKIPPEEAAKPIGDILSSCETFLKIINRFLTSTQNRDQTSPRRPAPTPHAFASSSLSMKDVEIGDTGEARNSISRFSTNAASFKPPSPSSQTLKQPQSSFVKPPTLDQLDTTTVLLILTCYIRLLFIYTTLFSYINQYLSSLSSSPVSSSHEPLHIGGFSLHSYGEIQIKILVDISIFFITSIEQTLGAPRKYTLRGAETDDEMEFNFGSGSEGALSMRPQMKMLLETVIKTVELDNHEGQGARGRGITALQKEFQELQESHKWKL